MLFPTAVFTAFFLLFLGFWWTLPAKSPVLRSSTLLVANLLFYGWLDLRWSAFLLFLASLTWVGTYWIAQSNERQRKRRGWITVCALLSGLVLFKYFPWLVSIQNELANSLQVTAWTMPEWAYPAGLSFFTFHALAIVVGVWHKRIAPPKWLFTAVHISFFPTLMAGPVLRPDSIAPRLQQPFVWHDVHWMEGCARFLVGMTFKWVLATKAASWADPVFQGTVDGRASTWWGVHAYAFQIFFDFAGYSLMAIGIALLLGFRLPENFTSPYTANSLKSFWQRWHRSLSFFFRDHLYIDAFGGNAKGTKIAALSAFATMIVSGLWHGASLMFLIWGIWHGAGLVIERQIPGRDTWAKPIAWLVTFEFCTWGWVWFRADTWGTAVTLWRQAWSWNVQSTQPFLFDGPTLLWGCAMAFTIFTEPKWLSHLLVYADRWDTNQLSLREQTRNICILSTWAWLLMVLGPEGVPNFIYNGF